jgi:hypothetical protein
MPRGDRTGPTGMGPMSGRATGYCGGFEVPGFANAGLGRGRGWGFGRGGGGRGRGFGGRGRAFGFAGPPAWTSWDAAGGSPFDAEAERQVLRSQAEALRAQLRAVESRLEGHEKKEEPE